MWLDLDPPLNLCPLSSTIISVVCVVWLLVFEFSFAITHPVSPYEHPPYCPTILGITWNRSGLKAYFTDRGLPGLELKLNSPLKLLLFYSLTISTPLPVL